MKCVWLGETDEEPSPRFPDISLCLKNAMSWATAALKGGLPVGAEEVWLAGKWVGPEDAWVESRVGEMGTVSTFGPGRSVACDDVIW